MIVLFNLDANILTSALYSKNNQTFFLKYVFKHIIYKVLFIIWQ